MSSSVQRWRNLTKERMVNSLGGKCANCGYNKCNDALDFHHLDPNTKEFNFGFALTKPKSWNVLVKELKKCVLLCSNCHRELHAGLIKIENKNYFNEDYIDYKIHVEKNECPVCGTLKLIQNKTCSKHCSGKLKNKVNWSSIDLNNMLSIYKNPEQIGKFLGVSGSAVRKQIKKNKNKLTNGDVS